MTRQFNASLLDKSLDDIEDLAGFEVPVNGVYTLKVTTQLKVVNDKDCIETNFEVIECIEQNNAEDPPTKAGTKFSVLTQLENDIALGRFKAMVAPIAQHFNESNLATLVTELIKDLVVQAKVKRRADKNDADKFYADVSNITLS